MGFLVALFACPFSAVRAQWQGITQQEVDVRAPQVMEAIEIRAGIFTRKAVLPFKARKKAYRQGA